MNYDVIWIAGSGEVDRESFPNFSLAMSRAKGDFQSRKADGISDVEVRSEDGLLVYRHPGR